MSIVKAINDLSGKEANTIEKAVKNLELSGRFDVNVETEYSSNEWHVISFDKTNAEMLSAYNSGMMIVAKTTMMGGRQYWQLTGISDSYAAFCLVDLMGTTVTIYRMELLENNSSIDTKSIS